MYFKSGNSFEYRNKKVYIKEFLGDGGQGEVYLVEFDNKKYAFKIYKDKVSRDFIYNLEVNASKGAPDSNFLWPKEVIEFCNGIAGYFMDLRPSNYIEFSKYINGYYYDKVKKKKIQVSFKSLETKIRWAIELCKSFKALHEKGYSYQDLNDGSFFLDPETGDLLICDNDNVTANQKNLGVIGKMKYMAPEIVRGERFPDTHSDRFSLAIILFMSFCYGDPFIGERLKKYDIQDEKADLELYGSNPCYVYHNSDKSNRPIKGYHDLLIRSYNLLPKYIKDAFHKTFVDGQVDRENSRTTEIEWIKLLSRYRDELITCSCNKEYYYGIFDNNVSKCPHCNTNKPERTCLFINKQYIVLEPNKSLYSTHLDKYSSEYNKSIGLVVKSKNNPNLWGIKVDSKDNAEIKDKNGNVKVLSLETQIIPIISDLRIKFNEGAIGEIRKVN